MTDKEKKIWKQLAKIKFEHKEDVLANKANARAYIDSKAQDGKLAIHVWQMDCDCASWDYLKVVPANSLVAIEAFMNDVYDNAEGPVRISYCSPDACKDFKSESRDHALEAFEDGHPHYVTY